MSITISEKRVFLAEIVLLIIIYSDKNEITGIKNEANAFLFVFCPLLFP